VGSFPPCLDAAGPRVQANLNGGEENLGDILDDLDIPVYDILCGQRHTFVKSVPPHYDDRFYGAQNLGRLRRP
jgi:hypothetical protein